MTNVEALEILRKESKCRHENVACLETTGCLQGCPLYVSGDDVTNAIDTAIEALELMVCLEDDKK